MNPIVKSAAGILAAAALSACSSFHTKPVIEDDTAAYVDEKVEATVRSIDKSLQTLVVLERGDEAPRRPGALGDTVAGGTPAKPPIAVRPSDGGATRARMDYNRGALATRVRLQWDGPAVELISQLGRSINYGVQTQGSNLGALSVSIRVEDATVEEVLRQVARQIEGKADIQVETVSRTLHVVRRGR